MNPSPTDATQEPLIELKDVAKVYKLEEVEVRALDGVDLVMQRGEYSALIGPSGSGKSTLMNTLGCLDRPTRGSVAIDGKDIHTLDEAARGELRNRTMGFIYQFHHLLPEFSALENVAMPLLIRRVPIREARQQAQAILEKVGLGARLEHRPHQLSGGERQRAAVARALVTMPLIVFADEPTGNLDGRNAEQVFELMLQLNREHGTSLVIVTHDLRLASRMDRVWLLENGRLKLHE